MQILGFGSFQASRKILETRVVNDMPKCFFANVPLSNSGMTVHTRAERGFGIVQMKRQNILEPNLFLDFANGGVPTFWRPQVVARLEKMRGIQTNAQALRALHPLKYSCEIAHSGSH